MAGRKRRNDPDGLRRRVLDAAFEAFQARGYHATSMHDLLRLSGLSGGALAHHFPTKKALALAVLRERVANAIDTTWIAPVRDAATTADGVAAVLAAIAGELCARGGVRGCPLNNLASELALVDPDFRSVVAGIFRDWREALARKLRAEGAGDEADALASFIVSAYSGAMAQAKAEQNPAALGACAASLARLLTSAATIRP